MIINLGDFHNRDRRPNEEELRNLPTNCPAISGEGEFEDKFSVDAALDHCTDPDEEFFYADLQRWVFRLN